MAYTYEELKGKTIAELREIAKEQGEAVQGYTQMNKDHLLPALCQALGIDARAHHVAHGEVKEKARARMKDLRERRQKAVDTHDAKALRAIRREYHRLNHRLRRNAKHSAAS
ncbi:MAG: Rho termination factor N-terminal domain-containing protein [Vicinamibacterales bacterium]